MSVSVYRNSYDTAGVTAALEAVIQRIKTGDRGLAEKTRYCNALAITNPKAYKVYKEKELPAVTFSGTFPAYKRKAQHLAQHSGDVVLDIDGLMAEQIVELLAELAQMPHIVLAFLSPSAIGIKVLVRVDPIPQNDLEHKGAYAACLDFFGNLAEEYGFTIDTSGKDCSRLCYLAHDPLAIVHANAPTIPWDREAWLTSEKQKQVRFEADAQKPFTGEVDITALDYIDPNDLDYNQWLSVITAGKVAGLTWQQVDVWSRRGGVRYQEGEVESRWNGLNLDVSWGAVVNLAKLNGYEPPRRTKAKLTRNTDETETETETLDANRAKREAAADTSLSTDTTDSKKIHMILVKDSTGAGKSHTFFAKAKQYGKRTLAELPHTALAEQAVEIALKYGFLNPCHLKGREHNWEASGIAEIPVEQRTEALFEKNNCIRCDKIQDFKDSRLAPRTYCELFCPHLERDATGKIIKICPHLEQYQGLEQRDFVATCSPNILFNLNTRGYLKTIVTAAEDPSDEDLAIDAMMGTESEATTAFDFAILDDYGIDGLYTDITLNASEFKALKKAWRGTPTATFAKRMLKAFEKKKPQKIVKALRKAFESTAEHHAEIAKSLTQHARYGTVEYAERPKSSKETKRLLSEKEVRYEDGGTQFIPVNFDAYEELTKKGIPCIHPQHIETDTVEEQVRVPHTPTQALLSGVPLKALTPVWQKGATPIELIGIFLSSIGNDKNAAIKRAFIAGDPPDPVLNFSIQPQAPIGILPQIAMLSATTPPEDTQRTFDGQAVTFSVHEGGVLAWAEGVQVYQFIDGRMTSASVFEYPTDADGKRKLQETPVGLTTTAANRLAKLNNWAKAEEGLTAFISYKEFTEVFQEAVNGFDIVTHFDKVAGLNFDGLKFLVVFGYPKVKHEIVMEHAKKQFASDTQPLPKADPDLRDEKGNTISEYAQLTEDVTVTENGITLTERRYKDTRLEKVRHQLATEKLEQAIGRARFPVWTDTLSIAFTSALVPGVTERATLFSSAAFTLAETPSELPDAVDRIQQAEETGDVRSVMETKGVSERTAQRQTKDVRDQQTAERDAEIIRRADAGETQQGIADALGIRLATVNEVLSEWKATREAERNAEIFRRYDAGETQEAIAAAMSIKSKSTVSRVLKKRNF